MAFKNISWKFPYRICTGVMNDEDSDDVFTPTKMNRVPVILNVYDMIWTNDYTTYIGLGVFHSGVQVYDMEFGYAGHPFSETGIFEISPRDEEDLGEQFQFRKWIHIGYTDLTKEQVRDLIDDLGKRFQGNQYHLMKHNCNHFSSYLTQLLCGKEIPKWVNRLAHFFSAVPFLQKCFPTEWLIPALSKHSTISMVDHSESEDNSY